MSAFRMILFYSDYCPHCRMLIDTIERHDSQRTIKLVSLEALKARGGRVPPQVTAVPALVILPSKDMLIGKAVFDYLLLPGKGKLLTSIGAGPTNGNRTGASSQATDPTEPMAYSISTSGLSDAFASIEDESRDVRGLDDRSYAWTAIENDSAAVSVFPNAPFQEETRSKKGLPDLDAIKSQRDMELTQNDLNTSQLTPPSSTRY